MFEVGKRYELHRLEYSDGIYGRVTSWAEVTKVDMPLIEVNGWEIINVKSPVFEGAVDEDAKKKWADKISIDLEIVNFPPKDGIGD